MSNQVGNIIWQQIPVLTKFACGARNAATTENGLIFEAFNRRGGWMHKVAIDLNGRDLYDLSLLRIGIAPGNMGQVQEVAGESDVYCDQLAQAILGLASRD